MRVLFASTAGAGHFGPLVPFANAIRRAGHDVLVAAPMSAQARVERAGLPFISFADPLERDLEPVWARIRAATPERGQRDRARRVVRARARPAALPGVELAMDAWRPDVVLRDSCEFASAVAAEAREVPVARVGPWLLAMEAFAVRAAAPAVDDLRRWAGLEPDPAGERLAASPYLTLTPARSSAGRPGAAPGAALPRRAAAAAGGAPRRQRRRSST